MTNTIKSCTWAIA